MSKFFLHMGLHKTGTKFFQHKVFVNLNNEDYFYNPPKLTQLLCDLMKANDEDLLLVLEAIISEKKKLTDEGRDVVLSREIVCGDLFSFYKDKRRTISRLYKALPEAKIILFRRYQVDWIVSCYRETIHEHHYQSIQEFLSLKPGNSDFQHNKYQNLDINGYINIVRETFGEESVHVLFYEDFRKNKFQSVKDVAQILGLNNLEVVKDSDGRPNRGYSAFSIQLSILRFKFFNALGLKNFFVHRPINFFGEKGIPAGFQKLSVLPSSKYWHNGFLRDNEEIRSDNWPNLSFKERFKLNFSWRRIVKNGIDKLFYWDWDLLGTDLRREMDHFFQQENRKHLDSSAPKKYFE